MRHEFAWIPTIRSNANFTDFTIKMAVFAKFAQKYRGYEVSQGKVNLASLWFKFVSHLPIFLHLWMMHEVRGLRTRVPKRALGPSLQTPFKKYVMLPTSQKNISSKCHFPVLDRPDPRKESPKVTKQLRRRHMHFWRGSKSGPKIKSFFFRGAIRGLL